jgi:hypothetical protein
VRSVDFPQEAEYDRALVDRGDVTFWLTPRAIATWIERRQRQEQNASVGVLQDGIRPNRSTEVEIPRGALESSGGQSESDADAADGDVGPGVAVAVGLTDRHVWATADEVQGRISLHVNVFAEQLQVGRRKRRHAHHQLILVVPGRTLWPRSEAAEVDR